jgi:exodeoxyribonuclease V alpha subunit
MNQVKVEGVIQSVYVNREYFSIGTLQPDDAAKPLVTFLGKFSSFPGEELKAFGHYETHKVYGERFIVDQFEKKLPRETETLEMLLSSGIIEGVGPRTAAQIVEKFGASTLEVLESGTAAQLKTVSGIGKVKAKKILTSWQEYRQTAHVLAFFLNQGFNLHMAKKLIRRFPSGPGHVSPEVLLREDPYRIAWVSGIGWARADAFAEKMGVIGTDIRRIRAAVLYALMNAKQGHTYLPQDMLRGATEYVARVQFDPDDPEDIFVQALRDLEANDKIKVAHEGVYHTRMYFDERTIATGLMELNTPHYLEPDTMERWLAGFERKSGVTLSDGQRKAVALAYRNGVSVITGGPGTGKTSTIQGIIALAKQAGRKFALAAPTGRAAKRITESTGYPASTIHRLLEFKPLTADETGRGMFLRNSDNKLDIEMLVVDEMSMADTSIIAALVDALPKKINLVLCGDVDQLESVGAGNVLNDIIGSNAFYVTHLRQIFRQAAKSKIITNAYSINSGLMISNSEPDADFHWIKDPSLQMIDRVVSRFKDLYNLTDLKDVQIITPFRKNITDINVTALNTMMQARVNPGGTALPIDDCPFRVGDKVIQTSNNYERGVFNGDVGYIDSIDPGYVGMEGYFNVQIDDELKSYHFREWKELELAYAITAHKSQGGEYPYVLIVLPPDRRGDIMLRRNLLYTSVTRASKHCIVIAREREVKLAVQNKDVVERFTGLKLKLNELKYKEKKAQKEKENQDDRNTREGST